MKKLKIKVFAVIFSLLTIFTLIIFVGSTMRTYLERKNTISEVLLRVPNTFERDIAMPSKRDPEAGARRIFLDFVVYTVILDDGGNYQEIINNTYNEEINEEDIMAIANNIINNHTCNIYIGNLYTSRYAYAFTGNNSLIIMDNIEVNSELLSQLITNIFLFLICEVAIFFFTYIITNWITLPVKESFQKQKTFVADASHELKTPLSVMIASADAYFNDKDEKWVMNMKNESERMIKLVTELLDLAKIDEEQTITMSESNLSEIIEGAILTCESLFYENKIKLKYEIEPDIKMSCNDNLIVDLVSILIDNAINHCSDKGKVLVNLNKKNKQIVLEVKNTGLPIKKEDEEKIFERFYKADTSRNRDKDNYGLGLAIAKNIVLRHHGEISAHSSGGYTTFKVIWNQK